MTETAGIVITGVSGRMGQMLVELAQDSDTLHLAAALERPGHAWVGQDLGQAMGGAEMGVLVTDDTEAAFARAKGVIDFTAPAATVAFAAAAQRAGIPHVIGTTGMTAEDMAALDAASRDIPIVQAGNMSLGVNLLCGLVRQVSAALGEEFDIEVIEAHHHHKVDAPSGTALMLGEAAAKGRGLDLAAHSERARDGITGARAKGAIGFSAIRGGDIVGEHDVLFAGPGERLILRHVATDRRLFGRGALTALSWALRQPPGRYSMDDVLGL